MYYYNAKSSFCKLLIVLFFILTFIELLFYSRSTNQTAHAKISKTRRENIFFITKILIWNNIPEIERAGWWFIVFGNQ